MHIVTTKKFDKQFRRQPKKIQQAFAKRVTLLMQNRHARELNTHRLTGNLRGVFSFNVTGDVRVIFDEQQTENVLVLIAIGTHSELYG